MREAPKARQMIAQGEASVSERSPGSMLTLHPEALKARHKKPNRIFNPIDNVHRVAHYIFLIRREIHLQM